ncbi:NCS2 family permease [Peribacillus deserti]|uniref:Permease n=1 Tax=Peribacillus deserti TaxID=673318 RepID=A0A2N5M1H7_9BACI|nr:NCS2 family permease [Peribacillus deserti]PLT28211.1 permease [Peribacillus deserti]
MDKIFKLEQHGTTFLKEVMAGLISFITIVYIVAVNSAIMADAGIPYEPAIIGTILTCVASCFLVGFWSNAPLILAPGMGINVMFAYTLVQKSGLSWQEALAVVTVTGILFMIIAFTPLASSISKAIPHSLKEGLTVGIGILLTLIGLQKTGVIISSKDTLVSLGNLADPAVLATLIGIIITVVLFIRNVPGNILISIIVNTIIAFAFGLIDLKNLDWSVPSFGEYKDVFGALSFSGIGSLTFWFATFSLAMVVIFENIGLVYGQTRLAEGPEKYKKGLQATSVSVLLSGIFGSSPTVATVEATAGITAGGRTGLTSVVTGFLFLLSLLMIPLIKVIPDSAISPVLILIGALMLQSIKGMNLDNLSESFPAYVIIVFIPLTYSIVDGLALGFIAYPLIKLLTGRGREVSITLYIIAALFLTNFIVNGINL